MNKKVIAKNVKSDDFFSTLLRQSKKICVGTQRSFLPGFLALSESFSKGNYATKFSVEHKLSTNSCPSPTPTNQCWVTLRAC